MQCNLHVLHENRMCIFHMQMQYQTNKNQTSKNKISHESDIFAKSLFLFTFSYINAFLNNKNSTYIILAKV